MPRSIDEKNNLAAFVIYYRYIKLSSPNLNNVIILGCIMVYSTIFLYGLDGRVSDKAYSLACRVSR